MLHVAAEIRLIGQMRGQQGGLQIQGNVKQVCTYIRGPEGPVGEWDIRVSRDHAITYFHFSSGAMERYLT